MHAENKHKVLVSIVGLLSLGAGSVWFFGGSAERSAAEFNTGSVRRAAPRPAADNRPGRGPRVTEERARPKPFGRKIRTIDPDSGAIRHSRRQDDVRVHKEKIRPAC
jgi:hypothetical protein